MEDDAVQVMDLEEYWDDLKTGGLSLPAKPRASARTARADSDGGESMASVRKISSAVVPVLQGSLSQLKAPPMSVLFSEAAGVCLSGPRLANDALHDGRETVADNSGEGSSSGALGLYQPCKIPKRE